MGNFHRYLLVCIGVFSLMVPRLTAAQYREAVRGVVDLGAWKGASTLALSGEWLFFPQELLTPQTALQRLQDPAFQPRFITIGQSFAEAAPGAQQQGFGTYVLRIKHWPTREPLGFNGVTVYTAANIYFFGADGQGMDRPVQAIGQVAQNEGQGGPQLRVDEMQPLVTVEDQDYFFLIQVSNFHHAWGGLWRAPEVASIKVLNAADKLRERIVFFVLGCLLFAAAYNLSLFTRRPEDKGSLILACMALELGLNTATNTFFPATVFGSHYLGYAVSLKTLYLTMMFSPMLAIMFLRCYFPQYVARWLYHSLVAGLGVTAVFFVLAPVRVFSVLGTTGQVFALTAGSMCSLCAFRAWRAGERGASLVVWGCLAVLAGGVLDVLGSKGILLLPVTCLNVGLMVLVMTQSQIVGVHFAHAFRQAEHLSRELKSEVDRQTRDIKSILDSIQQGIFTLVDTGWTVGDQYSSHLKKIVRQEQITGTALRDLLLRKTNLSSDTTSQMLSALNASMGEDVVVFEVNSHCLVPELQIRTDDGEQRTLEVEWTPMVDARQVVDKVLVCVRDVTELRALKIQAQQQEEELRILQEILRIHEDRFQRFILFAEEYLQQSRQLIANAERYPRDEVVRRLFMNMHTIKGTARTYYLYAMSTVSHDVEQSYAAIQQGSSAWDTERLLQDLDRVSQLVRRYEQVGKEKLGWSRQEKTLRLPRRLLLIGLEHLLNLHQERLSAHGLEELVAVEGLLMENCYSPIQALLEDSCKGLDSLARDLQKLVPRIAINSSRVIIRDEGADLIHSILVHLLRNSLDHGLETAEERIQAGKIPQGTVTIEVQEQGSDLWLYFADDGRGLDLIRIEAIGRARGLIPPGREPTPDFLADLIFAPGFSTKGEVTEISGRGVGLDAVRDYLKQASGSIGVEFLQGHNFRFAIQLPGEIWWSPSRAQTQATLGISGAVS